MSRTLFQFSCVLITTLTTHYALGKDSPYQRSKITFESNDGYYYTEIDARAQLDMGFVDSETNPGFVADNEFRRVRFALKSKFGNTWATEIDFDFADNEVDLKDLWVAYIGKPNWNVKLGNHKPNFSLAEVTSSKWYTFLEVPAVVEAFGTGRKMGLSVNHWQDHYFFGVGAFGDEVTVDGSDADDDDNGRSERIGYAFRATFNPLYKQMRSPAHFHLGVSHINYTPESDDEDKFDYDVRPENRIANYKLLDTGKLKPVDRIKTTSLEVLYSNEKLILQSEYLTTKVTYLDGQPDFEADGFYVQGSYFLWGYGREYRPDIAELGPVNIRKNQTGLEVAARFSQLDLNDFDAEVTGGEGDFVTLGVNWYANYNLVFKLNYIIARYDEYADGDGDFAGNDTVKTLGLRVQYAF